MQRETAALHHNLIGDSDLKNISQIKADFISAEQRTCSSYFQIIKRRIFLSILINRRRYGLRDILLGKFDNG